MEPARHRYSGNAAAPESLGPSPTARESDFRRCWHERVSKGYASATQLAIPPAFHFLGTDVDFGKSGVIVEVQFSNYPFLLNNILRSELFFKAKTLFSGHPTEVIVIITKDGIFPASNSTLYYQQAVSQLSALANYNVFAVPTRLVCLSSPVNAVVPSTWTTYSNPRYSRSVATRINRPCQVSTRTRRTSTAKRVIKPALKPAVAVAARGALQRVVLTFPLNPVP
jgi:hypothetical protein